MEEHFLFDAFKFYRDTPMPENIPFVEDMVVSATIEVACRQFLDGTNSLHDLMTGVAQMAFVIGYTLGKEAIVDCVLDKAAKED